MQSRMFLQPSGLAAQMYPESFLPGQIFELFGKIMP